MPDTRKHRGPHPEDARLFAETMLPRLRSAVSDVSWLLTRGYAQPSAVKIVGDRYELDARQRMAVTRAACTDVARDARATKRAGREALAGQPILIDGYNVLTTIETALGGGIVFRGRDGCVRDIAGVHGTWRRVEETSIAIDRIGRALSSLQVSGAGWLLDRPVSNSGRLATMLRDAATRNGWPWEIDLVASPDAVLAASDQIIITTADSAVLDRARRWFDLVGEVLATMSDVRVIDLHDAAT